MMALDWLSVCLGVVTILVFLAIFTLLRTMNSPYIARFRTIVRSQMVAIDGVDDAHRIIFNHHGRAFELMEAKYEVQEDRNKVYNSYILLGAKSKTDFTLHLDDVLNKITVAGILEKALGVTLDYKCYPMDAKGFPDLYRDFKIWSNNMDKAKIFLKDPEVIAILTTLMAQFSVYGFLMPMVINRGDLIIDYSLSKKLLDELVFDPRKILEHIRLLDKLAVHIERL
jgi:hypothetical protein